MNDDGYYMQGRVQPRRYQQLVVIYSGILSNIRGFRSSVVIDVVWGYMDEFMEQSWGVVYESEVVRFLFHYKG